MAGCGSDCHPETNVGASLLAKAVGQPTSSLTDTPSSRAGSLPHFHPAFIQSSLMVIFGIAGVAASCKTMRAPTWRASS
ncbi:hypothetical protein EGJ55_05020 [Pseudomonas moraviensis]|nr:hypothetical protein EGJ55_05020 [Pseudomonas moraviensis]